MLFTERKALEIMFSNLEDDKRQIKKQAREDIDNLENRQMNILDRIQRLDNIEREAIDSESIMLQLAKTTQELGELIPQVSAGDVIERAAEKIANNPENQDRITANQEPEKQIMREKVVEAARLHIVNSKPAKKPAKPQQKKNAYDMIDNENGYALMVSLLENGPLRANEIAKGIKETTGKEYANIYNKVRDWMKASKGTITKQGPYYYYQKENEEIGEQPPRRNGIIGEPGTTSTEKETNYEPLHSS